MTNEDIGQIWNSQKKFYILSTQLSYGVSIVSTVKSLI